MHELGRSGESSDYSLKRKPKLDYAFRESDRVLNEGITENIQTIQREVKTFWEKLMEAERTDVTPSYDHKDELGKMPILDEQLMAKIQVRMEKEGPFSDYFRQLFFGIAKLFGKHFEPSVNITEKDITDIFEAMANDFLRQPKHHKLGSVIKMLVRIRRKDLGK